MDPGSTSNTDPSNPDESRLSRTSRRSVVTLIPDEPLNNVSNVTITLLHLKERNFFLLVDISPFCGATKLKKLSPCEVGTPTPHTVLVQGSLNLPEC